MSVLRLFGHRTSQPTRAVLQLLACNKHVPYCFEKRDPMAGLGAEFAAAFPTATIPALEHGDLHITEAPAILAYVCDSYGLERWYARGAVERARVDEAMHWHHSNTRLLSTLLVRPLLFSVLLKGKLPRPLSGRDHKRLARVLGVLETWLAASPFLAARADPSVADLLIYCEFDQIVGMADLGRPLLDLAPYPSILDWLARCRKLPEHDELRGTMRKTLALVHQKANEIEAAGPAKL